MFIIKKYFLYFILILSMFLCSLFLFSPTTFAYSTNAKVGDEVIGVSFNFDNISTFQENLDLVSFSDGGLIYYDDLERAFVVLYGEHEVYIYIDNGNQTITFDKPYIITNIQNLDKGIFSIDFTFFKPLTSSIFSVFDSIGVWLVSSFNSLILLFYSNESGLTFLGVLAVAGLAISVIFLIISVIRNFLHFRG